MRTADDIASACADLSSRGPFPAEIARALAANDPEGMRAAVAHLIGAGRFEGLGEVLELLRGRRDCAVWARVQSARLRRLAGDNAAALADLDDLMRNFPQRAAAAWWVLRARCLAGLGRNAEAQDTLQAGLQRFPDAAPLHAALAQTADDLGQWARALALWDEYALRFQASGEPAAAAIGRARALFRLDRIDEATQALEELLANEPDHPQALRELAAISTDLGETRRARDLRARLLQRHADAARPEWWSALARAHHDLGEDAAGAAAMAELERRFPDTALAEAERLRLARMREHGHDDFKAMVEAARARFPSDANIRGHWVWLLLSLGRLQEAEHEVEALEADEAGPVALVARFRLEADRGDENLRALLARWVEQREFSAAETIALSYQLFQIRTRWAFAAGARLVAAAEARDPGATRLAYLKIRFAIALRRDDEAAAEIDALPKRFARHEQLELRAWAAARRGRDEEAKALCREALAGAYYAAIEAPIRALTRISPDDRPPPGEGVTAYVVFRNEAAQIPGFLAHHRRLGVRRFVFFDHMSTDGGRELALGEPDVIVYDCPDSYQLSSSGRRWVNEIVAREGARGWGLQLDMDEHLIYPGCETLGLDGLIAYLEAHGYEGVRGFMLDMFPPRLIGENGELAPLADYVFYDDDYFWFGSPWSPYLSPSGGVRARLFEGRDYLHKTPIWRLDAGRLINSHETTHLRLADVSAALKHYKLMNMALIARAGGDFLEADADVEAIRRHSRYAARFAPLWRAELRQSGTSQRLDGSLGLVERGLMQASDRYRRFLAEAAAPR